MIYYITRADNEKIFIRFNRESRENADNSFLRIEYVNRL